MRERVEPSLRIEDLDRPFHDAEVLDVAAAATILVLKRGQVLLEAVRGLFLQHPDMRKDFRIRFIGRFGEDVMPLLEDPEIRDSIILIPHTDHRTCLEYTIGSDALLLLIPVSDARGIIVTGKVFEYLRSGRPILCISKEGEASRIVTGMDAGVVISPDDIVHIQHVLWTWFDRWKHGRPLLNRAVSESAIRLYDRRHHAAHLAGVLDGVLNESGDGNPL